MPHGHYHPDRQYDQDEHGHGNPEYLFDVHTIQLLHASLVTADQSTYRGQMWVPQRRVRPNFGRWVDEMFSVKNDLLFRDFHVLIHHFAAELGWSQRVRSPRGFRVR